MKQEMFRWNIFQPLSCFEKYVHDIFTELFIEINKVINATQNTEEC